MSSSSAGPNIEIFGAKKSSTGKNFFRLISVATVCSVIFAVFYLMASTRIAQTPFSSSASDASLFDEDGRYIMRNYDDIKPNSNFLAGLGGLWGVPMVCNL